jgi:arginyl-tRNA synthetase
MIPSDLLRPLLARGFEALFQKEADPASFQITPTRKEFEGHYTLLVFPLTRLSAQGPEPTAQALGTWLMEQAGDTVAAFQVVKGFLNLSLQPTIWHAFVLEGLNGPMLAERAGGEKVLVEFASPNTNKPLHLGHIRNILLGWAMSRILERTGHKVTRVQVVNDRGIAICKSMLAWSRFAGGATPESTGIKGDHLVGDYYVRFETAFREEYLQWQLTPQAEAIWTEAATRKDLGPDDRAAFFKEYKNTYFNEYSTLGREARDMLLAWEEGDTDTRSLWTMMNQWVYQGFEETYQRLGVGFDKSYYESDTYLLGKDLVEQGLRKEVFYRKEDGSVWVDLSDKGLDHKILLRSDGTSVYITQDLGTAEERYGDFEANRMIYVVADEQNYHFQVLFETLKRLGAPYAEGLVHLSYGMVELPTGRMKSREGTVVDADDLIAEVIEEARRSALEHGEMEGIPDAEQEEIFRMVGMAALKFHIIKVNPRKKMIFDPGESVDMQGHTGPYIQNAYVRIQSILDRAGRPDTVTETLGHTLQEPEQDLLLLLAGYGEAIHLAAEQYDPSHVANYAYQLARAFHKFYHDCPILRAENEEARQFRLRLAVGTALVLEDAMGLLGIEMPRRM